MTCETNDFLMKDPDQTLAIRTADAKYITNNWKLRGQLYFDEATMEAFRNLGYLQ